MVGVLGLVGCAQNMNDVKSTPAAMTVQVSAPYKVFGQCLQQEMRDENFTLGRKWAHDLLLQDWVPSAELVAGTSYETGYVVVLTPLGEDQTHLTLHTNSHLMGYEVTRIKTKLRDNLETCETLLTRAQ
jgi:hypothetical protein